MTQVWETILCVIVSLRLSRLVVMTEYLIPSFIFLERLKLVLDLPIVE